MVLFSFCTKQGPYDGKTPDDNSFSFYFNNYQYKEFVNIKYTWFGTLRNPEVSANRCDKDIVICAQVGGDAFCDSLMISAIGFHIPQSLLEEGKTIHLSGEQVCVWVASISSPLSPIQFLSPVMADLSLDGIGECVDGQSNSFRQTNYQYVMGRFSVDGLLEKGDGEVMDVHLNHGEFEIFFIPDAWGTFYGRYSYYYEQYINQ